MLKQVKPKQVNNWDNPTRKRWLVSLRANTP